MPRGKSMGGVMMVCLEALAFSSILAASVAGTLVLVAGGWLMNGPVWSAAGLAFAGTLVVYNLDHLLDLERDRIPSPRRSAFVRQRWNLLIGLVVVAGVAAALLAWQAGPTSGALCAAVLVPSLFHRRIKQNPCIKVGYMTAAWVAILVGLPALGTLQAPASAVVAARLAWQPIAQVACVFGAAIAANLIAATVGRQDDLARSDSALWGARVLAAAGGLIALAGPPPLRALAWVPLAQLASLTAFRGGERARLILIDGSLLLGGVAALLTQRWV